MPVEIKTEYKEFIKTEALKGYSGRRIKKELDRLYKNTHKDVPSLSTVKKYTALFKAASTGHVSSTISPPKNIIDEKYRIFIENRVHQGKRGSHIVYELWNKYGKNSVSKNTVIAWVARIKAVSEVATTSNHQPAPNSSNSTLVQHDRKKQEFIKIRVKRGLTVSQIKKNFDLVLVCGAGRKLVCQSKFSIPFLTLYI